MIKHSVKMLLPETWAQLGDLRMRLEEGIEHYRKDTPAMGLIPAAFVFSSELLARTMDDKSRAQTRAIKILGHSFPIEYRPGTSDIKVIRQVLVNSEYKCVSKEKNVMFILDCGANIGCTTAYFLERYPAARVVAVEPDASNIALCRRNLAPYGERVKLVESGVWPTRSVLKVERGTYRDGQPWSTQVRPVAEGEKADIESITIDMILDREQVDFVDLLKIDIEAAEAELFGSNTNWLDRVRTLVIEIHGQECERIIEKAMSIFSYKKFRSGELTVYRRIF